MTTTILGQGTMCRWQALAALFLRRRLGQLGRLLQVRSSDHPFTGCPCLATRAKGVEIAAIRILDPRSVQARPGLAGCP